MTSTRKDVRMKRSTADRLLKGVQERILEVNRNPDFCYYVREAVVFGSYVNAPEKDMLGDLDIALDLVPRYDKNGPEMQRKMCEYSGHGSFLDYLDWPLAEVLKYIRNKSGYISLDGLHMYDEEDAIIFSGKTMNLEV